jgi:osmotically-inducible protein OsmY
MFKSRPLFLTKYLPVFILASAGFLSSTSYAGADLGYQYLPVEQVESNIKASLSAHEINTDALNISSDDQGVVNISGNVASKEQADLIVKIAQTNTGVYAVLGQLSYFQ